MVLLADGEWEPTADTGEGHRGTGHKRRGMWGQQRAGNSPSKGLEYSEGDLSAFLSGIGFSVRV